MSSPCAVATTDCADRTRQLLFEASGALQAHHIKVTNIPGVPFAIDHGTGIVIGETAHVGKRVRMYQGVTLGALSLPRDAGESLRNTKRHPTLEDDVIVSSNTTILGGDTVIGAGSVIGGNIWLTESVSTETKVLLKRPELIYQNSR